MTLTNASPDTLAAQRPPTSTQPFAWQGWCLRVPRSWNAVRLDGDFAKGYAMLADMDGPRLGVRWSSVKATDVTQETLRLVMRDEVGEDAAKRAKPLPDPDQPEDAADSLVHLDPNPPGRDVNLWWTASERLLELVYHAPRRDNVLVGEIIPSLSDSSRLSMRPWAVFDLACCVPGSFTLTSHRLNAGDLSLEFGDRRRFVIVRQIALAEMALRRTPLAQWLAQQRRPGYRATGDASPIMLTLRDGRPVSGLMVGLRRRLRFRSGERVSLALHDEARDRLVLVEASDELLARDVARTVGCDFD